MKLEKVGALGSKKVCSLVLVAALSYLGMGSISHATLLGLPTPPEGSLIWDTFVDENGGAGITVTNAAPTSDSSTSMSGTLSVLTTGGGSVTGSGDRLYNGNGASSVALSLSIAGTIDAGWTNNFVLYMKITPPDVSTGLTRTTFFNVTLNGVTASAIDEISTNTGDPAISGQTLGVVRFTWTGLSLGAGDAYNVAISSPASGHVSVDSVQAVPEPSTYALMALGLGALAFLHYRRKEKHLQA